MTDSIFRKLRALMFVGLWWMLVGLYFWSPLVFVIFLSAVVAAAVLRIGDLEDRHDDAEQREPG